MPQGVLGRQPRQLVVGQHPPQHVQALYRGVRGREQGIQPRPSLRRHESQQALLLRMRILPPTHPVLLVLLLLLVLFLSPSLSSAMQCLQHLYRRGTQHFVNATQLIDLVLPRKQGPQRGHLKDHTAHPPHVHRRPVPPIRQQTLRRPVPARRNVLGEGGQGMNATARAKIGELDLLRPFFH